MSVSRLKHITQIGVEQMGELADSLDDPNILRFENLDTDLRPPQSAIDFTKQAVDNDDANSYLPFFGLDPMRQAAAMLVGQQSGQQYDWKTECIISAGGLSGILNVLLATIEPGDEVLMTDPIYVGLINRVRLAGGVPRYVSLAPSNQGWSLDIDGLNKIDRGPVKVALLMSPSMPTGAVFNGGEWQKLIYCVEKRRLKPELHVRCWKFVGLANPFWVCSSARWPIVVGYRVKSVKRAHPSHRVASDLPVWRAFEGSGQSRLTETHPVRRSSRVIAGGPVSECA